MRTPAEYAKNLKNGIVTDEMMSNVLYSYSKRAKNYRDKIREYKGYMRQNRYFYDVHDNIGKMEEKKEMLYGKKSDILSLTRDKLVCIHKQDKHATTRYYDYEKEYEDIITNREDDIVWYNSYYDHDKGRRVEFVDVFDEDKEYLYFLYYEFPLHSFHTPIEEDDLEDYNELEMIEIDDLETYGDDINDLLSLQFCDKVYNFLMKKKDEEQKHQTSS